MERESRRYYEAYDERYRTIHGKGYRWSGDSCTPVVMSVIRRYGIGKDDPVLEIGCGEGRDAAVLLDGGYDLLATDISPEAVSFCRRTMPRYADRFDVLDCLNDGFSKQFGFIYAIAVVHMLTEDEDRKGFYTFIRDHLAESGLGLVCSMGDGETSFLTDPAQAFDLKERSHPSGKVTVAATTCRMVDFPTFEKEILDSGLKIVEQGITSAMPDFDKLMYAVVKRVPSRADSVL